MSLTAFLPTGAPQVLPFIGTPGAATVGHALVWSEAPQGFTLSPITVGPDQFSGVLSVSKGGWGTNTGSFTSPGAITLAAGGTNQNITLQPSGTGSLDFGSVANPITGNFYLPGGQAESGFNVTLPPNSPSLSRGIYLRKGEGFFAAQNGTSSSDGFSPTFIGKDVGTGGVALAFGALSALSNPYAGVYFVTRNSNNTGGISSSGRAFYFENGFPGGTSSNECLTILGNGASTFHSTTESTSTTTGAVRISGGLGVASSVNIGGNLKVSGAINFANLPTSNTGLAVGDLWRDGELVKVKL